MIYTRFSCHHAVTNSLPNAKFNRFKSQRTDRRMAQIWMKDGVVMHLDTYFIVSQTQISEIRWGSLWNSYCYCTQNSARCNIFICHDDFIDLRGLFPRHSLLHFRDFSKFVNWLSFWVPHWAPNHVLFFFNSNISIKQPTIGKIKRALHTY